MNKEQIINKLLKLKDKEVIAIIDEGRARKREERGIIRGIYDRVFTIEINNVLTSFSYSDLICKTIILKTVWLFSFYVIILIVGETNEK